MIYLGPVPGDEQCEQLGPKYNKEKARKECQTFIKQILRELGDVPEGAELKIHSQPHDFGTYIEVVYTATSAADYEYGTKAESIREWDEQSKRDLGLL